MTRLKQLTRGTSALGETDVPPHENSLRLAGFYSHWSSPSFIFRVINVDSNNFKAPVEVKITCFGTRMVSYNSKSLAAKMYGQIRYNRCTDSTRFSGFPAAVAAAFHFLQMKPPSARHRPLFSQIPLKC